jgi:PHS family inorganic phosphate transporter-like MFS transporter
VGTGGSWFLFDIALYGNITFTPFVLELVFKATEPAEIAALSTLIGLVALPGLYLASFTSDSLGRKRLQIIGFGVAMVLFLVLYFVVRDGTHGGSPVFVFLVYCLTFFFYNFGPNATTFTLPAETFSNDVRTFFSGLSAAFGKLGAVVGASFFKLVLDSQGVGGVMLASALVCAAGILLTLKFVKNTKLNPIPEGDTTFDAVDSSMELVQCSTPGTGNDLTAI